MQRNHGGPAKGSWGDRFIIENPKQSQKISCSKCINYCVEDRSCTVRPVYCPVDSWDMWKSCERFELATEYKEEFYESKVRKVKGSEYLLHLEKIKNPINIKKARNRVHSYQEKVFHDGVFHLKPFEGYVKGRMVAKYGGEFIRGHKILVGEEWLTFSIVSSDEKMVVSAKDYLFEKDKKTRRSEENIFSRLNREVIRLNMLPDDVLKLLVIVKSVAEEQRGEGFSLARKFCEKYQEEIKGVRIIEVDEEGNMYEII